MTVMSREYMYLARSDQLLSTCLVFDYMYLSQSRSDMRLLSAIPRQPLYIPHFCTPLQSLSIARSDSVIDTIANDPSM
jgi:hypothetical protein